MRLTKKSDRDSLGYEPIEELVKQNNASPIIAKLGQLEDLMEKYNIADIGELECIIQNEEKGTDAFVEYWEKRFPELLKPYKDIEKEIGIDLITLFKAIKDGVWVKTKNGITKHHTVHLMKWQQTSIYCFYYRHYSHIWFKDYGKTWALTKEELK